MGCRSSSAGPAIPVRLAELVQADLEYRLALESVNALARLRGDRPALQQVVLVVGLGGTVRR
jgi:hypothetical protein